VPIWCSTRFSPVETRDIHVLGRFMFILGADTVTLMSPLDGADLRRESADRLAGKTAAWGVERVDLAMGPILARIAELEAGRDALEVPEDPRTAAADAAAAWDEAAAEGEQDTLRAMVRRAFPDLVLAPPARRGDWSVGRLRWDGPRPATT
jgi:hypothetical protein